MVKQGEISQSKELEVEIGKRHLVEVMVIEGTVDNWGNYNKKLKNSRLLETKLTEPEVVLETQHFLHQ